MIKKLERETLCKVEYGVNPHIVEKNEDLKKPYCNIDFINQFELFKAVHGPGNICTDR